MQNDAHLLQAADIGKIFSNWQPSARLQTVEEMTPDASLRRYYRLFFSDEFQQMSTCVAMVFDSVKPAEAEGGDFPPADQAYLELADIFRNGGVAVPDVLCRDLERHVYFLEDLGTRQLADVIICKEGADAASGKSQVLLEPESNDAAVIEIYTKALEQILLIQKLRFEPHCFAFRKFFSQAMYVKEMSELLDFYFDEQTLKPEQRSQLESAFSELAQCLVGFRQVLTHRDFHSWNLIIDSQKRVRVIDFQDALVAPYPYDVVALLNDRGTDLLLGKEKYLLLVDRARDMLSGDQKYFFDYAMVLLQRDLKVLGRFAKLAKTRGLVHYCQWIPPTAERIGRTLAFLTEGSQSRYVTEATEKSLISISEILRSLILDVDKGFAHPLFH